MDIPHFIQHPPSDTEMETARLLAEGHSVKKIAEMRNLSPDTIQTHTKRLRFKFHAKNMQRLMGMLFLFSYLKTSDLIVKLPAAWVKYLK